MTQPQTRPPSLQVKAADNSALISCNQKLRLDHSATWLRDPGTRPSGFYRIRHNLFQNRRILLDFM